MFPDIWKKSNKCHKKGDKLSIITNQCHYKFEGRYLKVNFQFFMYAILYVSNFLKCLEDNKLLSVHQSGFRPSDSNVNQLLSIVHNLCKAFDAHPTLESHGVFLDMSKAFENFWHERLIFRVMSVEVSGSLLHLAECSLSNRFRECC